jgi:hypothetical protein
MPAASDAPDLLRRLARRYRECHTYADRGVVTLTIELPGSRQVIRRPFATAFIRPDQFRFEFRETGGSGADQRYIVWQSGATVRTYRSLGPQLTEGPDLGMALASATGVSGGSAVTIPTLLLPEVFDNTWSLADLADAGMADSATIVGHDWGGRVYRVTIDLASLLVLRIEEPLTPMGIADARASQLTSYEPVVDVPLEPKLLAAAFPAAADA